MRIRNLGTSAVLVLVTAGPALADSTGLQVAQRSLDMGYAATFLADQAGRKNHANWHNGVGHAGLSAAAEAGQLWYFGKGQTDRAASASHVLGSSLGLSYSDGVAWTLNLSGTRLDGHTQFGTSGGYDLSGYGFTVSGTHRYGDFFLATHDSFTWLDFNHAWRKTGGANAESKSNGYAESLGVEAGYRFVGGEDWSVIPSLGIRHDDVSAGGFGEHGALAMSFSKGHYQGWEADAGISAEMGRLVFSALEVRPAVDLRYERWLGAHQIKVTGTAGDTWAAVPGRNALMVRPELDFSLGGVMHLNASYLYRWQKTAREQGVWLRLAIGGR